MVNEPTDDPDKEALIASRLRVPRHLVGLFTRLQQIEEGERYGFIGLNPQEWAAGLKIHFRR